MLWAAHPLPLSCNTMPPTHVIPATHVTVPEKCLFLCFTAESKIILSAVVSFAELHTWSGNYRWTYILKLLFTSDDLTGAKQWITHAKHAEGVHKRGCRHQDNFRHQRLCSKHNMLPASHKCKTTCRAAETGK